MQSAPRILCSLMMAALLTSCSSTQGPKKPQPGSPEFNWLAALEAFDKDDLERATQLLTGLAAKENPYQAKAQSAALALTHGLASAYMNLAEKYATGAKKARVGSAVMLRQVGEYKGKAKAYSMNFAETGKSFLNAAPAEVVMAVPLPSGPTTEPELLKKAEMGVALQPADFIQIEKHVVKMEVARSFQVFLGALNESTKAQGMYQDGEAKIPASVFMYALGEGLVETAEFFGPKKLNESNIITAAILDEAIKAMEKAKPGKDTDKLTKKAKDARKAIKIT